MDDWSSEFPFSNKGGWNWPLTLPLRLNGHRAL